MQGHEKRETVLELLSTVQDMMPNDTDKVRAAAGQSDASEAALQAQSVWFQFAERSCLSRAHHLCRR